jgi:DNA gyrase subunit B
MAEKPTYDESDIRLLKPNEHVRLRPGMYFGGTDKAALHGVIDAAIDESVIEALNSYANHIWITLRPDCEISIQHDGRGVLPNTNEGVRVLELIMTSIGYTDSQYRLKAGLHRIHINYVNALAAELTVEATYERTLLRQSYQAGIPQTEVVEVRQLDEGEATGMTITFRPDFTILEPNDIDYEFLLERSREVAYLLPHLTITLRDERSEMPRQDEFYFANGLADYVALLNRDKTVLHNPVSGSSEWTIRPRDKGEYNVAVDLAFQYTDTMETTIIGYVNTFRTAGGLHTDLFPFALFPLALKAGNASLDEISRGLTAIISVKHPYPVFNTHADLVLRNNDVAGVMFDAVKNAHTTKEYAQFQMLPAIQTLIQKH